MTLVHNHVEDQRDCERVAHSLGAEVFTIEVASSGATHDPEKLASALCLAAIE